MAGGSAVLLRYATALHELALAEGAEVARRVGDELGDVAASLREHVELQERFESPRLTREKKRALVASLISGRSHDLVRRTLLLLVDKGRAGHIADLGDAYEAVARRAEGRLAARVESAVPLDDARRAALVGQLARITGQRIELSEQVVPELLGGLRVRLGSRLIDASLSHRLERMHDRLLRAPLGAGAA